MKESKKKAQTLDELSERLKNATRSRPQEPEEILNTITEIQETMKELLSMLSTQK